MSLYGKATVNKYARDGVVQDILEGVAPRDDVSDFSDLSDSDEEEWTTPSLGAPDHSSEDEEADDFCGGLSSPPGRNWEEALLEIAHPEFSGTFSEPNYLETPIVIFRRHLTDDMLAILVDQTNLYSAQKYGKFVNTSVPEVEQYIGMYLKMCLVQMPNVRCYWEQGSRHSPIADTMPRNRFLKFMACLHVVDNMQVPEQEKKTVWKLRPWIVALQQNLEQIEQQEYNAIDEIMVPFTGRSTRKQYTPNKPVP
ncbi:hypothetical protein MRX96_055291 [Rhipicephalus microplus]